MDIKEIKDRKSEAEALIQEYVSHVLTEFKEDTGVTPTMVNIDIISTATMGENVTDSHVGKVIIDMEI